MPNDFIDSNAMQPTVGEIRQLGGCQCDDGDCAMLMEFEVYMGGTILINVDQILVVLPTEGLKTTEIRVFQNSYMVKGDYASIKERLAAYIIDD